MDILNETGFDHELTTGYVNSAFMLLFFLIGLPWNAMVIGIILKRKLYTQPSLMLMLNLAISNLLVCLCIMPITIIFGIGGVLVFGNAYDHICKTGILLILLPLVSTHTIALMSADRVIYLKKPLTYHLIVTPWRMFAAITVMWIFSIGLSLPLLFVSELVKFSPDVNTCSLKFFNHYRYTALLGVVFVMISVAQFIGCGCIIYIARKYLLQKLRRAHAPYRGSTRHRTQSGDHTANPMKEDYNKSQLRLVVVFGSIFTVSLVTLIPAVGLCIAVPIIPLRSVPTFVFPVVYISYLSRSVIYPILESTLTHEIRTTISSFCSLYVLNNKCKLCHQGKNCTPSHDNSRVNE